MTYEELFAKIQSGELPPAGIIRRSGSAKDIRVTTKIDGQTVDVPMVDVSSSPPPSPESNEEST